MAESGIKNLDKLLRKLDRLDDMTKGDVMRKAVTAGAGVIQTQAKKLAPKDKGDLKDSISVKSEFVDGKAIATVYVNKSYGAAVEFGTGPRGEANKPDLPPEIASRIIYHQGGWYMPGNAITKKQAEMYHLTPYKDKDGNVKYYYTEGQKPQPFMYPAVVMQKENVNKVVAKALIKGIAKMEG